MTDVNGVAPIGAKDYAERIKRGAKAVEKAGFGALIVAGGSNARYFCGSGGAYGDRLYAMAICRDGSFINICPAFEERRIREALPDDAEVIAWQEDENPFSLVSERLKSFDGPIALEDTMPLWYCEEFRKAAPQGVADGSNVMRFLRAQKTERELEIMRLANTIIGEAVREAFSKASEGMTNLEMAKLVEEACAERGVRGCGFVLFGEAASFPHGTKYPQKLKKGDVMLCDAGCVVEGYISDITRSVVFGKANERQQKIWDVLREAQLSALAAAKVGNPLEAPDLAAREVLGRYGFGSNYETFTHRLGHGIGLDGHEWPYLCRGNKLPLEENMTFSDEPGIYIPGEIGMRLEDCFHVTKTGGKFLAEIQKDIKSA